MSILSFSISLCWLRVLSLVSYCGFPRTFHSSSDFTPSPRDLWVPSVPPSTHRSSSLNSVGTSPQCFSWLEMELLKAWLGMISLYCFKEMSFCYHASHLISKMYFITLESEWRAQKVNKISWLLSVWGEGDATISRDAMPVPRLKLLPLPLIRKCQHHRPTHVSDY